MELDEIQGLENAFIKMKNFPRVSEYHGTTSVPISWASPLAQPKSSNLPGMLRPFCRVWVPLHHTGVKKDCGLASLDMVGGRFVAVG